MNKAQKWALWVGVAIGAAMFLYPPWRGIVHTESRTGSRWSQDLTRKYGFLFYPPRGESYDATLISEYLRSLAADPPRDESYRKSLVQCLRGASQAGMERFTGISYEVDVKYQEVQLGVFFFVWLLVFCRLGSPGL